MHINPIPILVLLSLLAKTFNEFVFLAITGQHYFNYIIITLLHESENLTKFSTFFFGIFCSVENVHNIAVAIYYLFY